MITRWFYYVRLGVLDLVRLWSTTQHHVIIVAGICLPILLLLGLKRGHVANLRKELLTSPTGRQVMFWSAQKGELMTPARIASLQTDLPAVQLIIPETQRVVALRSQPARGEARTVSSATLYSTRQGDPLLQQLGATLPQPDEKGVVLAHPLATQLDVKPGDSVQVVLTREKGEKPESVTLDLKVLSVIPTDNARAMIGYLDVNVLDRFEQYIRGYRVADYGWPAAKTSARDAYSSYLVFCEKSSDLTADDREQLKERGLVIEDRTTQLPEALTLLLKPDKRENLRVYELSTSASKTDRRRALILSPSELSQSTAADDVVVPWNEVASGEIEGKPWLMVGLSLPKRTWLREYFRDPALPCTYDDEPMSVRVAHPGGFNGAETLKWPLRQGEVSLKVLSRSTVPAEDRGRAIAVVPANVTAWLAAHRAGMVDFDPLTQLFVAIPDPPLYDKARLYAQSIDDIPAVVEALNNLKFAVMSETARITEIHDQDRSLQLLVLVVGTGVFLFGVVTVFSVLLDSTDRKRGTIGILRVMGMSRAGIFMTIFIRAAVIGILAAGLSAGAGYLLSLALAWPPPSGSFFASWKPVVAVELYVADFLIILGGALVCCGLGALLPAWKASRLDPFDAIVEGRFR